MEWLDFTLYLYLAKSVFAVQFFPPTDISVMLSFALFAAAYLARPLGGWLLGGRADRQGRRRPMIFSATLMGGATFGICLLPSYSRIGISAAWILLCLRILQGIALGGEINTSGMFLLEHYPGARIRMGTYVAAVGALGMFSGGCIAAFISYYDLMNAWRLVFALVGGLSLWISGLRKQLPESPEFNAKKQFSTFSMKGYWRGFLNIAINGLFVSVTVYLCNAFWISYAIDQQLWSKTYVTAMGASMQLLSALFALLIAHFLPISHAAAMLRRSMLLLVFVAPFLFYCTTYHLVSGVYVALLGYALANGLICSSLFYFLYLQLPAVHRCQGVSTIWAIAASVGALSLPLAEYAVHQNAVWFPPVLVSMIASMCFFCSFLLEKKTSGAVVFYNGSSSFS